MNINFFNFIVSLAPLAADPVEGIYLALAVKHFIIMIIYLNERKYLHAFCEGLSATLYSLLAGLHVVAH